MGPNNGKKIFKLEPTRSAKQRKKNSRILREAIRINQVQTTIRIQEFCLRLASLLLLLLWKENGFFVIKKKKHCSRNGWNLRSSWNDPVVLSISLFTKQQRKSPDTKRILCDVPVDISVTALVQYFWNWLQFDFDVLIWYKEEEEDNKQRRRFQKHLLQSLGRD